ncbi:MAG: response regulator transcription factor [Lachnospiraceae bacterium]|nr:response regulator transcription factor [Lachnospiraceae bacterium]
MCKILLLEDDKSLIDGLKYSLEKNGFSLTIVNTLSQARKSFTENPEQDLLLLDITLPDGTGFELCEYIRNKGNSIPIIFLTASDEEVNIIRGLDSGGDDYITKPFKLGELISRINALLRRTSNHNNSYLITCGDTSIDLQRNQVTIKGNRLDLTAAEYRLLCLFIRNKNHVVSRNTILNELWDKNGSFVDDNTLSVYIRRLREKTEKNPSKPDHLITVRGFGYQWNEVKK